MLETIQNVLIEAINDEYKARATYQHVIDKFGKIRPFVNIIDAESRHIRALLPLFEKYGIDVPEDDWASRTEAPASLQEACQLGVAAEIENGQMYDRLLALTVDYPDIHSVLLQLQRASVENHLPALQRCVERGGRQGQGRGSYHRHGRNV